MKGSGTLKGGKMVEGCRSIPMVQSTKDIGLQIFLMAGGVLFMQMEMYMPVSGRQIRLMDLESMSMRMAPVMKDNGKTICIMVRAKSFYLTIQLMKGSLSRVRSTDEGNLSGLMPHLTRANFLRTLSKDMALMFGLMVEATKALGRTTICTAKGHSIGQTEDNLLASMWKE